MGDTPGAGRPFRREHPVVLLARRERWVVTTQELRAAGCSPSKIKRLCRAGWLSRIFHGVYLVGRTNPTDAERERAAVKACGDGAVLSHRSAAVRWGVLRRYRGPVEVTAPTERRRQPGLRPHRARLDRRDVTVKDGVSITTLARTLVDLAMVLDEEGVALAVHEAENLRRLRVPAVDAAIARAGARRRGLPALRRALDDRRPNAGGLKAELERKFHRLLHRHGFPPADHNVLVELAPGEISELDVLFGEHGVGVELDAGPHMTVCRFHSDRRKDRRLFAQRRLVVLRVTHQDVDRHEAELAADLWAALGEEPR